MRRRLAYFMLLMPIFLSCRTTPKSETASHSSCQESSALDRVLSLILPEALDASQAQCLQDLFQQELDQQRASTKDKVVDDRFDQRELSKNSSQLGSAAYSRKNLVDLKAYIRGDEIFSAHRRLIAAAKQEVLLQTFVWDDSSASRNILQGIKELEQNRKANCAGCPPVVVRLVANFGPAIINSITRLITKAETTDYGDNIKKGLAALRLDPSVVDAKAYSYRHEALGVLHVKSLVVDNQIAMVTGANAQRFLDNDIGWYDVGFMMAGDVAQGLRIDFINNLIRSTQGRHNDGDQAAARELGVPYEQFFSSSLPVKSLMSQPFEDAAGIPMLIVARNGSELPSKNNHNTQNRAFQSLFASAKKSIAVQSPNFNDDAAIRGLGSAVKRGVKVDMVLSKLFNCNSENQIGQGGQNEKGIKRFLTEIDASTASGARHDIRWFSILKDGRPQVVFDNPQAKRPEDRPLNSHAKFLAVDNEVVVVGSANLDTQSWNQSREINVIVFHPQVTEAWQNDVFNANFQIAQPVGAEELIDSAINCDGKQAS